jgi:hypothetical protein
MAIWKHAKKIYRNASSLFLYCFRIECMAKLQTTLYPCKVTLFASIRVEMDVNETKYMLSPIVSWSVRICPSLRLHGSGLGKDEKRQRLLLCTRTCISAIPGNSVHKVIRSCDQ